MDENTPANTPIGEPITATDPDEGDVLYYSLTGADDSKFSIDPSSGQLRTELDLDYESSATHSVTVVAKDDAITPLSDEIGVTITVNNLDEPGSITILPLNPRGEPVTLTATLTDPDGTTTGVTWQWAAESQYHETAVGPTSRRLPATPTPPAQPAYTYGSSHSTQTPRGEGRQPSKRSP